MSKQITEVVHSKSKPSWKIVGTALGGRYNWARVDYLITGDEQIDCVEKFKAMNRAQKISRMFNEEQEDE